MTLETLRLEHEAGLRADLYAARLAGDPRVLRAHRSAVATEQDAVMARLDSIHIVLPARKGARRAP